MQSVKPESYQRTNKRAFLHTKVGLTLFNSFANILPLTSVYFSGSLEVSNFLLTLK